MLPAQQGLHAADIARGQAHLGLVVQSELVALQCTAQGVFQLQRAHRLGLHFRGEEAEGVAAIQLGAVHGHVCRLGKRVEVAPILREQGHTHGWGHGQLMVVNLVVLAGRLLQLACHPGRAMGIGAWQQQDELVPAQAGHGVLVAHHSTQPFGNLDQQGIAHAVSQRVVHVLEMVQVQEDHCQRRVVLLGHLDGLLGTLGQQCAVGQAGERIVVGQPVDALLVGLAVVDLAVQVVHRFTQLAGAVLHLLLQFLVGTGQRCLGLFALGDVHRDPDGALRGVGGVDGLAANLADHRGAVLAAEFHFAFIGLTGCQAWIAAAAHLLPSLVAGVPAARRTAHEFAGLEPQHLFKVVVAPGQAPVTQKHNAHHGAVEQQLLFAFSRAERGLGAFLFVDVVEDPDGAFGGVVRIDEPAREAAPEKRAVTAAQLAFHSEGLPLGQHRVGRATQLTECFAVGVEGLGVEPYQACGAGVAKNLSVSLVAADHAALAQENDTYACSLQPYCGYAAVA